MGLDRPDSPEKPFPSRRVEETASVVINAKHNVVKFCHEQAIEGCRDHCPKCPPWHGLMLHRGSRELLAVGTLVFVIKAFIYIVLCRIK